MMIKDLKLAKNRKLVGAVVICVVLIASLTVLWRRGQVAEAAVLYPHAGLVGWWRFDEEGGIVAEDSSGYGNHGTVYGATSVNGKYNKGLSFDGVNDFVQVTDAPSLHLTNVGSITAWFRSGGHQADWAGLIAKHSGNLVAQYSYIIYRTNSEVFTFAISNGTASDFITKPFDFTDTNWHFIAARWDGNYLHLSIDLVEATPVTQTVNAQANSDQSLLVGDFATKLLGDIDEVCIYNRALSAAEIQESFKKGPNFSSRLQAKVPNGTTQFVVTLSWLGVGSIGVTIESPYEIYTEDTMPVYLKTSYSSGSGDMLNIKRLSVSIPALLSDEDWYIELELDDAEDYKITVEVQR